jgi:hypothetical protein
MVDHVQLCHRSVLSCCVLVTTARKENVYSEESNTIDIRPSMLDIKVIFHVTDVNMPHLV